MTDQATPDTGAAATPAPGSDAAPQTPPAADVTPPAGEGEPAADPPSAAEPAPYTFTLPEGMEMDTAAVEKFTPLLQKHGLSQEAAQELVTAYAEHLTSMGAGAQEAFDAAYTARREAETAAASQEWLSATKADAEIGGKNFDAVLARVQEAVGAVGTPEAKQAFNDMGWGNHPELVRMFNRLIDYTPQDKGVGAPGGNAGPTDLASVMYPNMPRSRK